MVTAVSPPPRPSGGSSPATTETWADRWSRKEGRRPSRVVSGRGGAAFRVTAGKGPTVVDAARGTTFVPSWEATTPPMLRSRALKVWTSATFCWTVSDPFVASVSASADSEAITSISGRSAGTAMATVRHSQSDSAQRRRFVACSQASRALLNPELGAALAARVRTAPVLTLMAHPGGQRADHRPMPRTGPEGPCASSDIELSGKSEGQSQPARFSVAKRAGAEPSGTLFV